MRLKVVACVLGLAFSTNAFASGAIVCKGEFEGNPLAVRVEESQFGYYTLNYGAKTIGGFSVRAMFSTETLYTNPALGVALKIGKQTTEGTLASFRSPQTSLIKGIDVLCNEE